VCASACPSCWQYEDPVSVPVSVRPSHPPSICTTANSLQTPPAPGEPLSYLVTASNRETTHLRFPLGTPLSFSVSGSYEARKRLQTHCKLLAHSGVGYQHEGQSHSSSCSSRWSSSHSRYSSGDSCLHSL
jgi:hypothetical protein